MEMTKKKIRVFKHFTSTNFEEFFSGMPQMFQYLRIMPHSYSYQNHLHCFDRSHSQQPSTSILMENITKKPRAFWVLTVDFLPGTPNNDTFKWMMIYDFQKETICKDLRFIIQLKTPTTHYKWMAIRFQVKLQVNLSEKQMPDRT